MSREQTCCNVKIVMDRWYSLLCFLTWFAGPIQVGAVLLYPKKSLLCMLQKVSKSTKRVHKSLSYMYIHIYKHLCIYTSTLGEGTPSHPNRSLAFGVLLPFVRVTLSPMGSKEGAHLTERGWKGERHSERETKRKHACEIESTRTREQVGTQAREREGERNKQREREGERDQERGERERERANESERKRERKPLARVSCEGWIPF